MTFAVCYVDDSLMDAHTVRTIKPTLMGIPVRAIAPLARSENRLDQPCVQAHTTDHMVLRIDYVQAVIGSRVRDALRSVEGRSHCWPSVSRKTSLASSSNPVKTSRP